MKHRLQNMTFVWLIPFIVALAASVAAAQGQTKLTIAYSTASSMGTGMWMAREIGAFEKYGLQAELIFISSGPTTVQGLIGGDIHAAFTGTVPVINAIQNGAPIIGVASTANRPYHRLFVQPQINRIEDLRGKTLGVTRFGGLTDDLTRILLRRNGLEDAVTVRQLGGTVEVGAAFQQRIIAGAVSGILRVPSNVPVKVLLNFIDLGIPYSMNLISVSKDFHRRHLDRVDGIVRAYTEGVAALNYQKARALQVIAKYTRLSDAKAIEELYQGSVDYLDRVPRAEPEALSTILDFSGKKGLPLETFVDSGPVQRMVRDKFIDRLYAARR